MRISDLELGLGSVAEDTNPEQEVAGKELTEHLGVCRVTEKG